MKGRLATLDDLPEVTSGFLSVRQVMEAEGNYTWSDGYPTKRVFRDDILAKQAYLLQNEGQTVGYLARSFRPLDDFFSESKSQAKLAALQQRTGYLPDEKYLILHRFFILPAFQKHGLGGAALTWLEKRYPHRLFLLAVYPMNPQALSFYLQHGYLSLGPYPDFEYGGEICLLLYKHVG